MIIFPTFQGPNYKSSGSIAHEAVEYILDQAKLYMTCEVHEQIFQFVSFSLRRQSLKTTLFMKQSGGGRFVTVCNRTLRILNSFVLFFL